MKKANKQKMAVLTYTRAQQVALKRSLLSQSGVSFVAWYENNNNVIMHDRRPTCMYVRWDAAARLGQR